MKAAAPIFAFKNFDRGLAALVGLEAPKFVPIASIGRSPLRQLNYIDDYIRSADLDCRSILLEWPYIDRDYMEEHAVFYSSSLHPYPNSCTRVHFFNLDATAVEQRIRAIVSDSSRSSGKDFASDCEIFSRNHYLGFTIIKPLVGSPVGRTVLRTYKTAGRNGTTRIFPCTRRYRTHVLGLELSVVGLAFQQQDVGVSACATTALWSALQRQGEDETAGPVPAQITKLASQYTLPFGRPMPSEGLSVEQMCMAVQTLGLSPSLLRTEKFTTARCYLYAAIKSSFAPVLILEGKKNVEIAHAVAVAGANLNTAHPSQEFIGEKTALIKATASSLEAVYIHDDRYGPYLRADLREESGALFLRIDPNRGQADEEFWEMTHILVPTHPKIRMSFGNLFDVALGLCRSVSGRLTASTTGKTVKRKTKSNRADSLTPELTVDFWIDRNDAYVRNLTLERPKLRAKNLELILRKVAFSRYVGIVRIETDQAGTIDVVVDTTSTVSNLNFLAVIARGTIKADTKMIVRHVSHVCQCLPFA